MAGQQDTNPDAEMNHEQVLDDFLESLDAEDAAEDEVEPEEGDEPDEAVEDAPEAAEDDEDEDSESDDEGEEEDDAPKDEDEEAPDAWSKRFSDQQSYHDKQMNEVKAQLEQMNQWAQQVYQAQVTQHQQQVQAQQQQAAQNPYASITREQIIAGVENDLPTTFQTVAQHRPDLVPSTISAARAKYGDEVGDQMQFDYNNYVRQSDQQQLVQQRQAEQERQQQEQAPVVIRETMNQIVQGIATHYGDSFESVREDFSTKAMENIEGFKSYMQQQGLEVGPNDVHNYLVGIYNQVHEERLNTLSSKPRKAKRISPKEQVETSTSGKRSEDMTADEAAINEILLGAKELDIDFSTPTS